MARVMTTHKRPLDVGAAASHYRLEAVIGRGNMGIVFRAYDLRLHRQVALKLLAPGVVADEDRRRQLRREAMTLSRVSHPTIAAVYDFDSAGETDFLVMELVSGQTLSELLQGRPLAAADVVRLGGQLAHGLEAAHAKHVVHRDIKPGNLRVTADGQLKILDFGIATCVEIASQSDEATTDHLRPSGTMPYMAPEQLRGAPPDVRSDIYSAGAVLYEMACGARPFPQSQAACLIDAILNQRPVRPRLLNPDIDPRIEAIALRALQKIPARRHPTASALAADLDQLAAHPDGGRSLYGAVERLCGWWSREMN